MGWATLHQVFLDTEPNTKIKLPVFGTQKALTGGQKSTHSMSLPKKYHVSLLLCERLCMEQSMD